MSQKTKTPFKHMFRKTSNEYNNNNITGGYDNYSDGDMLYNSISVLKVHDELPEQAIQAWEQYNRHNRD